VSFVALGDDGSVCSARILGDAEADAKVDVEVDVDSDTTVMRLSHRKLSSFSGRVLVADNLADVKADGILGLRRIGRMVPGLPAPLVERARARAAHHGAPRRDCVRVARLYRYLYYEHMQLRALCNAIVDGLQKGCSIGVCFDDAEGAEGAESAACEIDERLEALSERLGVGDDAGDSDNDGALRRRKTPADNW
jgi:hypothetical protein